MRKRMAAASLALLGACLSGCAVVSAAGTVASTAVDVGATAVGTAADAGSAVVRGAASTVSPSRDDSKGEKN